MLMHSSDQLVQKRKISQRPLPSLVLYLPGPGWLDLLAVQKASPASWDSLWMLWNSACNTKPQKNNQLNKLAVKHEINSLTIKVEITTGATIPQTGTTTDPISHLEGLIISSKHSSRDIVQPDRYAPVLNTFYLI